ncbi:DUF5949 family protein [Streptomyces sp. NPDC029526]|uniref:DUF5949 family protein n=1 Tax=Streptomyces sp. NPDC029526 TaxID=3155728 RepID=UPI0033D303C6
MTSTSTETQPWRAADLGSLVVMAWRRETPDGDIPFLLACSLGDGANGPEAGADAVRQLLQAAGLSVGGGLVDASGQSGESAGVLVVPGAASLTMPGLNAQFAPPPKWAAAAGERSYVYLLFATRPWPEGVKPGDLETLDAFTSDQETLTSAAHVLLPVRSLRAG